MEEDLCHCTEAGHEQNNLFTAITNPLSECGCWLKTKHMCTECISSTVSVIFEYC